MGYDQNILEHIFSRTDGRCHICRKSLSFGNYGLHGRKGAWEVEHSKPRAHGGTDHLKNLFAAHTTCNRRKRDRSTRYARAEHGYRAAPLSREKKRENAAASGIAGALVLSLLVPPPLRLAAALLGGLAGSASGWKYEPE